MITDALTLLDSAHAYTATAASTNYIDLSSDRDIGIGEPVWLCVQLDAASDGTTGDETYSLAIETDDNSSFSSATALGTITIPRSTAAGTRYAFAFQTNERYLRTNLTCGGTTPTVTLTTTVGREPPKWQGYPAAYTA